MLKATHYCVGFVCRNYVSALTFIYSTQPERNTPIQGSRWFCLDTMMGVVIRIEVQSVFESHDAYLTGTLYKLTPIIIKIINL